MAEPSVILTSSYSANANNNNNNNSSSDVAAATPEAASSSSAAAAAAAVSAVSNVDFNGGRRRGSDAVVVETIKSGKIKLYLTICPYQKSNTQPMIIYFKLSVAVQRVQIAVHAVQFSAKRAFTLRMENRWRSAFLLFFCWLFNSGGHCDKKWKKKTPLKMFRTHFSLTKDCCRW